MDVEEGSGVVAAAVADGEEDVVRRMPADGEDLVRKMLAEVSWEMLDKSSLASPPRSTRLLSSAVRLDVVEPAASAVASAVGGVSTAVAVQVIWPPVDVVSQRLMVQTAGRYRGGADAFRKILLADGVRGLYRGFGVSVLTYAPSSAAWWASYATAQRLIWRAIGPDHQNNHASVMAVQGASAAAAGGAAALVTMPLDTVKTRLQVVDVGARPTSLARSLEPKDIDILVVNCSFFSPTPSLSAMIINKYKLRNNIHSFNLSGMGFNLSTASTPNFYQGSRRDMLLPNYLFRMGAMTICSSTTPRESTSDLTPSMPVCWYSRSM